ncbi:MAG TPA: DUF6427 family protein, partial [Nitrosopumilaceae archaeon]|nr:DUF6427 family protein [Nitrosopumilaceae archaeon]
ALIYLLFSATLSSQNVLHPVLIANLLILPALMKFFGTYRSENSLSLVFDASFLFSCASLIYWPVIITIPVCFIAVFILKSVELREWILMIMGIILPFLITATLFWVCNIDFTYWQTSFDQTFSAIHTPFFPPGSFLINTYAILLMSLAFIYMFSNGFGGKVKTKKNKYVLIWLIFPGISVAFFTIEPNVFICIAAIIPFSILIGDYLSSIKKTGVADFLILLLITIVILSNLQTKSVL